MATPGYARLSTLLKTSFGFGSLLILLATAVVIIGAIGS